jgi:hypothetical protein
MSDRKFGIGSVLVLVCSVVRKLCEDVVRREESRMELGLRRGRGGLGDED